MILTLAISGLIIYGAIVVGMLCAACKHCEPHTYHADGEECPNKDS